MYISVYKLINHNISHSWSHSLFLGVSLVETPLLLPLSCQKKNISRNFIYNIFLVTFSLTSTGCRSLKLKLEEVSIAGFQDSSSRRISLVKDVLLDSASNFTVFWESLPDSDLLRIPGDDLQKYHQMIQAEKHSLSPVPRIFFLDGTVSSELLQSLRTLSPSLGWGFQSQDSCKKTNYLPN